MFAISEIIAWISEFALKVIEQTGYTGIFILSLLESAAIPIPSEVVVPFSGFLASRDVFSLWGVIFIATIANLTGSIILYWVGKSGGRWVLEKYGKYIFVTQHDLEVGDKWFARHGIKAIFWGRMLPVVRTFISLPAGIARMPFWEFCLFTFVGALPWNGVLAYVGFKAGEHWQKLHDYMHLINYFIVGAVVVFLAWHLWGRYRKNHG